MAMLYTILVYIHVLSVIMSIGPFFVLLPIIGKLRTANTPAEQVYVDTFKIAIRIVKHAGHVLVASGVLLVLLGSWSWATSWIVMTILIMFASIFFLARAFTPKLRKLGEPGHDRLMLVSKLKRAVWNYLILLLAMLWFMVAKPQLW